MTTVGERARTWLRARLVDLLAEPQPARSSRPGAALWVDPWRMIGKVCVTGTRLPASTIADLAASHGLGEVFACWPDLQRREVLVACWWEATEHPDRYPTAWRAWARSAFDQLAHDGGDCPDPPTAPPAPPARRRVGPA